MRAPSRLADALDAVLCAALAPAFLLVLWLAMRRMDRRARESR